MYRVWYYLWFQALPGVLECIPLQIRGNDCICWAIHLSLSRLSGIVLVEMWR